MKRMSLGDLDLQWPILFYPIQDNVVVGPKENEELYVNLLDNQR